MNNEKLHGYDSFHKVNDVFITIMFMTYLKC